MKLSLICKGKKHSEETKRKIGFAHKGKAEVYIRSEKQRQQSVKNISKMKGKTHWQWKEGITKHKDYNKNYLREWIKKHRKEFNLKLKERRHRTGVSKRYISNIKLPNKVAKKRGNQAYKRRVRIGGKLSLETIQLVYEDNIKKYGTLTCYLCLKPIEFGKDTLEHKIPLSRGGTNLYNNLAIACRSCNCKKHNKTEKEYKEEVLKYV